MRPVDGGAPATAPIPPNAVPRPVGVGVIGCGRIGQVHARAITALPGAVLVAVADPFEPFGLAVASVFGTTWVADWRELVADPAVDAVVIGSPTPYHAEQILACAAAGKAIFCETPISHDLDTFDKCIQVRRAARGGGLHFFFLFFCSQNPPRRRTKCGVCTGSGSGIGGRRPRISDNCFGLCVLAHGSHPPLFAAQAVDAAGVQLLVGFQRRFDSNFAKVQALLAGGAIGDVRTFTIHSRDPSPPPAAYLQKSGGLFLDMARHDFDMARFVCDAEIESVYVTGSAVEGAAREAGDLDTAITVVRMSSGAFGTIENSRRCAYGYDQRIEVFGGKGSIMGGNKSADTVQVHTAAGGGVQGLPYPFFMDRYAKAYAEIMGAFVRMVSGGGESPVTGADGRAPIVAALAAALSHREGRLVRLDEVDARTLPARPR